MILSRCLVSGPLCSQIDTLAQGNAFIMGNLTRFGHESGGIGMGHVEKSWAVVDIFAAQRIFRKHIDMVGDHHNVSDMEVGIGSAGSVADKEGLDAQLAEDADGVGDLLHGVALVVVEAPLHGYDVFASKRADEQAPSMSLDSGDGKVGNIPIIKLDFNLYLFRKAAKAAAEDDGDGRVAVDARLKPFGGLNYVF